ncbi:MAG: primosomal protein N' [Elusimicrobiota bacterium]|jgi:primosomal protein N' (replication factor Y)|nr:primosomal protein N' [Elusimicrobiota bacterium]
MKILEVAVPVPVDKTYHYLPLKSDTSLEENIIGKRVKVSFGGQKLIGFVLNILDVQNENNFKLKEISAIVDKEAVVSEEALKLAKYISQNYVCSFGEALACVVPISMSIPKRNLKPKENSKSSTIQNITLNTQQLNAASFINSKIENNLNAQILVHGITASGKTEVYLNCIETALSKNKSAIFLIPEISLTAQFVEIVSNRFGKLAGVWHSAISNTEKYKLFMKAKNNEIKIMLGARSAVFAPFKNLGIIIIDEEHEYTYKQEQKPSYDAREIAICRAKFHNAPVVFGSATPSLETYKNAIDKKLDLLTLNERIDKKELPEIKILSLQNKKFRGSLLLDETISAISKTLSKKEQVIVFLNRRGYSPSVMCKKCSQVYQCLQCSISMVYHKNPDVLKCHYCGQSQNFPIVCSHCKSTEFAVFGTGTQKVEDELQRLFKTAKVFRLDGDTAGSKEIYEKAYQGIKNDEYDILLGTQMIAKGFDFPRVSLACVIDADTSLYLPSFKAVEKTFQLITQVAGRSGRGNIKGNVIVQTAKPGHYAIECAKNHNFAKFYEIEIKERKKMFYPPFCDVAKISVRNKSEEKADSDCNNICLAVKDFTKNSNLNLKILGPVPAYISKLNSIFRRNIIIKGDRENILKLKKPIDDFKRSCGTFIGIEIMPSDLI